MDSMTFINVIIKLIVLFSKCEQNKIDAKVCSTGLTHGT